MRTKYYVYRKQKCYSILYKGDFYRSQYLMLIDFVCDEKSITSLTCAKHGTRCTRLIRCQHLQSINSLRQT